MAEQVEGDVAERDILLQLGGAGDPGTELLRQDQGVVAEAPCVLGDVGGDGGCSGAGEFLREAELIHGDVAVPFVSGLAQGPGVRIHRCGTPSEAV